MSVSTSQKVRRRSGGRPSQDEALRRDERLLEIAAGMFMERGFDATTIDAVAEAANVGKATLYARYKDKSELFVAVVLRKIDRWLAPLSAISETPINGRAEDVLLTMARQMVATSITPEVTAINRIVIAQAIRFSDLAQSVYREGWQCSIAAVATVLGHFNEEGQIAVDDVNVAAELFHSLVIGRQSRMAMLGIETDPVQLDLRVRAAVKLFLDGTRRRRGSEA